VLWRVGRVHLVQAPEHRHLVAVRGHVGGHVLGLGSDTCRVVVAPSIRIGGGVMSSPLIRNVRQFVRLRRWSCDSRPPGCDTRSGDIHRFLEGRTAQPVYKLWQGRFTEAWHQLPPQEQQRLPSQVMEALNTASWGQGASDVLCRLVQRAMALLRCRGIP
jgi:hypothetical protein